MNQILILAVGKKAHFLEQCKELIPFFYHAYTKQMELIHTHFTCYFPFNWQRLCKGAVTAQTQQEEHMLKNSYSLHITRLPQGHFSYIFDHSRVWLLHATATLNEDPGDSRRYQSVQFSGNHYNGIPIWYKLVNKQSTCQHFQGFCLFATKFQKWGLLWTMVMSHQMTRSLSKPNLSTPR